MSLTKIIPLIVTWYILNTDFIEARIHLFDQPSNFTLMLDPAGDAKNPGRKLDDSFERGITLQFAEQLKHELELLFPSIRIVLTRLPGETLQPLQNANFANRLDVDFYLSIHFYQERETKPNLYLYHFSYNDEFITRWFDLAFYPFDKAHLCNKQITCNWGSMMNATLSSDTYKKQFDCKGLYKLPFWPLIGIKAPAIALEAGLKNNQDWHTYIEPLVSALKPIIQQSI